MKLRTLAGLLVIGLILGVGPFSEMHSCSNDEPDYYPNVNSNNGGGEITFRGKPQKSCNIPGHNCPYGIDNNSDGWCDNCGDVKCHMGDHPN